MKYIIHTDGGSRGNPGYAAIGVLIESETKELLAYGKKIGIATNNTAEYNAVLDALQTILEKFSKDRGEVYFMLDSELVVKQLNGIYKIKDLNLKTFALKIKLLIKDWGEPVYFNHVKRELNKDADLLVNSALDDST